MAEKSSDRMEKTMIASTQYEESRGKKVSCSRRPTGRCFLIKVLTGRYSTWALVESKGGWHITQTMLSQRGARKLPRPLTTSPALEWPTKISRCWTSVDQSSRRHSGWRDGNIQRCTRYDPRQACQERFATIHEGGSRTDLERVHQ